MIGVSVPSVHRESIDSVIAVSQHQGFIKRGERHSPFNLEGGIHV